MLYLPRAEGTSLILAESPTGRRKKAASPLGSAGSSQEASGPSAGTGREIVLFAASSAGLGVICLAVLQLKLSPTPESHLSTAHTHTHTHPLLSLAD